MLYPKVFFRTDGSSQVGLGHVVRCLAVAQMLGQTYKEITFFIKEASAALVSMIKVAGFEVVSIEDESSFFCAISKDTIVVLDGYHFGIDYQVKVKNSGVPLVCIDDLHEIEFHADLIINHAPFASASDYSAQIYTHFALGPDYALLRQPFLQGARNSRKPRDVKMVLVCFGGSDSCNLTGRAINVLAEYHSLEKVIVVVGPLFKDLESVTNSARKDSRVELHVNVDGKEMAKLLMEADLAIVPASGLLMEAIAVQDRIVSGLSVENQKFMYHAFKKAGCFFDAGDFSISGMRSAVDAALRGLPNKGRVVDGESGKRILKRFNQLATSIHLSFRPAQHDDVRATFHWATQQQLRAFSFRQHAIGWEEHADWFHAKLTDVNCIFYMIYLNDQLIGTVRFDISNGEAILSYLIDPSFQSCGYGLIVLANSFKHAIKETITRGIEVKYFVGYVMPKNEASVKIFLSLGFVKIEMKDKLKFLKAA